MFIAPSPKTSLQPLKNRFAEVRKATEQSSQDSEPLLRCLMDSDRWESGAESGAFQPAQLSDKHLISLQCSLASAPAAPASTRLT
ncbi:hypothetical protein EYF80_027117 [Liparis tanakae]|uniref:Uncharacterized protein n=1 Tax=Liparis tanakae TaxID=230148 RepID=A0A4Z2HA92_9TELE|nr:hypothetical protein EYF80_027117 [Liparis tanakae]